MLIIKTVLTMTIKYGLQFFFFELIDNDGQHFLAGIVLFSNLNIENKMSIQILCTVTNNKFWSSMSFQNLVRLSQI
jgi:hypothetical protein